MEKYVVGIDGGGTKTSYLLADLKGNIVAHYQGTTIHYLQTGYDGLSKNIYEGLCLLCKKQNIKFSDIAFCFVGAAGYGDIQQDELSIRTAIKKALDTIPFAVKNDTFNAHAGALLGEDGICVIAGTGSIGLGIYQNDSFISGGWHHCFGGDEGSAHWIGEKYIQEFTKQSDSRHPKTSLYAYMKEKYQFENDSDILKKFIIEWDYDRTKIASLSQDVFALAKQNDFAAIRIFNEAAFELALIYRAIFKQLNFDGVCKASYIGGVFNSKQYILEPLKNNLNDLNITMVEPQFSADIGSVLLAYKNININITDEIINNLKQFQ